jgi:integrase
MCSGDSRELNPFLIREVRFPNGERMPLLVRRLTNLPVEATTYWTSSDRRASNKQATTLEQDLRNVLVFYLWAEARGLNPLSVLKGPSFLSLQQLNDLDGFCRKPVEALVFEATYGKPKSRKNALKQPGRVQVRNRMQSIHEFIKHVSFDHLSRLRPGTPEHTEYRKSREESLEHWEARFRSLDTPPSASPRKGLSKASAERLRDVIRPDGVDNPWTPDVRFRNGLIVLLLWSTGMRRGEVLGLETHDVQWTAVGATIKIVRRPDNPRDKRRRRPSVKTLGRELVLHEVIASLLKQYIMGDRRHHPGARKHPFIFCVVVKRNAVDFLQPQ